MRVTTVFFDLETAGVDTKHADIQLAAIAVRGWEEVGTFEAKIQFNAHEASPEALAINHYDPEVWKREARPEAEVVKGFSTFLKDHASLTKMSKKGNPYSVARLAGHNAASFDAPRLYRMFQRHGKFCPADVFRPLDTLQLALWHFVNEPAQPDDYKLGTLAKQFNIHQEKEHDALSDVRTCIYIAEAIITCQNGEESPF